GAGAVLARPPRAFTHGARGAVAHAPPAVTNLAANFQVIERLLGERQVGAPGRALARRDGAFAVGGAARQPAVVVEPVLQQLAPLGEASQPVLGPAGTSQRLAGHPLGLHQLEGAVGIGREPRTGRVPLRAL